MTYNYLADAADNEVEGMDTPFNSSVIQSEAADFNSYQQNSTKRRDSESRIMSHDFSAYNAEYDLEVHDTPVMAHNNQGNPTRRDSNEGRQITPDMKNWESIHSNCEQNNDRRDRSSDSEKEHNRYQKIQGENEEDNAEDNQSGDENKTRDEN